MPDPARLAAIHTASFTNPRPWSAAEIAALLAAPGSFLIDRPEGFVMGRVTLDEVELLTLAVAPEARRRGIGAMLLAAFEAEAGARGATRAYLEVAADNDAAQALYLAAGWRDCGRRKGYFRDGPGPAVDARVMERVLPQAGGAARA